MNKRSTVLLLMIIALAAFIARAEKPLKDYSFVRGVNYGMQADQATWNATWATPAREPEQHAHLAQLPAV